MYNIQIRSCTKAHKAMDLGARNYKTFRGAKHRQVRFSLVSSQLIIVTCSSLVWSLCSFYLITIILFFFSDNLQWYNRFYYGFFLKSNNYFSVFIIVSDTVDFITSLNIIKNNYLHVTTKKQLSSFQFFL